MEKILITGGDGYIAKSIYNKLSHLYNIDTISRKNFDLTDTKATKQWFYNRSYDTIIHTAIIGGNRLMVEDETILKNNLKMYYNLLECDSSYKKFINIGSGAEFIDPPSFYGMSKQIIDHSISNKSNFFNLRIYAVFDENELDRRFIKSNLYRYLNKESIIIYKNKLMDFIYMDDFIKIVNQYMTRNDLPKKNDCVYKQKYSLLNIANIINNLDSHNVNIKIEHNISDKDYIGNYYDFAINYIGLEAGIKHTYRKIKHEKDMVCPK